MTSIGRVPFSSITTRHHLEGPAKLMFQAGHAVLFRGSISANQFTSGSEYRTVQDTPGPRSRRVRKLQEATPGADLMLIEGEGSVTIPPGGVLPRVVEAVAAHTLKPSIWSPTLRPTKRRAVRSRQSLLPALHGAPSISPYRRLHNRPAGQIVCRPCPPPSR